MDSRCIAKCSTEESASLARMIRGEFSALRRLAQLIETISSLVDRPLHSASTSGSEDACSKLHLNGLVPVKLE